MINTIPFIVMFLLQLGDALFVKLGLKGDTCEEINPILRKMPFKLIITCKILVPFLLFFLGLQSFHAWLLNGAMVVVLLWNLLVFYFSRS